VILHALVDDLRVAEAAVARGATVVQLHLKGASTLELVAHGRPFRDLCSRTGVTFVVNDDVEAAIALEADGVHLGRDDPGAERAGDAGLVIGRSAQTLGEAEAVDAERPGYIGAGPIWPTPTKPDAPVLGLDGLRSVCAAVAAPVVAIGGIDATNAAACLAAGAAGVAVVRASADIAAVRAALAGAPV
jgi:thiamine-phosphate pyrophosphorylase